MGEGENPDAASRSSRPILLGVITTAHGVRGEVKLRSFTAVASDITAYGPLHDKNGSVITLKVTGGTAEALIGRVEGIDTRDAAERLRGLELFVPRSALPAPNAHEYYHEDLIGLKLVTETGEQWGSVRSIQNFGAGDLAVVAHGSGEEFLPFTRKIFTHIDFDKGTCVIHLPHVEKAEPGESESFKHD